MKRKICALWLIALATFGISFTSCGGDDEPGNGSYKFQVVSINGQNFYNCISGPVYEYSRYNIAHELVYEHGHYNYMDKAKFNIFLYDQEDIESDGYAEIYISFPSSELMSGNDVAPSIVDIAVSVRSKDDWFCGEDNYGHKVLGGSVKVANAAKGKDKVNLKFEQFKVLLNGEEVTINGEVTCEKF